MFTLVRFAAKSQPTQAIAGLIGVAASAALALWTGRAEDNYVLGFYTNAAYGTAMLVSLLVGWPLIGLVVGAVGLIVAIVALIAVYVRVLGTEKLTG